jgi:hypothetical protein
MRFVIIRLNKMDGVPVFLSNETVCAIHILLCLVKNVGQALKSPGAKVIQFLADCGGSLEHRG